MKLCSVLKKLQCARNNARYFRRQVSCGERFQVSKLQGFAIRIHCVFKVHKINQWLVFNNVGRRSVLGGALSHFAKSLQPTRLNAKFKWILAPRMKRLIQEIGNTSNKMWSGPRSRLNAVFVHRRTIFEFRDLPTSSLIKVFLCWNSTVF